MIPWILLWSNDLKYKNVFLFITDFAPYMVKADSIWTAFFPKLLHFTCLAHGFHLVSETIWYYYFEVNRFIEFIKKMFLTASSCVLKFKEIYPYFNLLLEPRKNDLNVPLTRTKRNIFNLYRYLYKMYIDEG